MKVLVTGASGFLGSRVVAALLKRGHPVRAMVRPATKLDRFEWADRVQICRGDLRVKQGLEEAVEGVDALVHLAACVGGDDEARFISTVVGTENLLTAMAKVGGVKKIVLASSFSVYDWNRVGSKIDESSPIDGDFYNRDSYTVAKVWQERVVRRLSKENAWDLRVVRPGFIWGRGNEWIDGTGLKIGKRLCVVIGPKALPPLTHVDNAADCFAVVTENDKAAGQTFNLVDGHGVTSWNYVSAYLKGTASGATKVPVPYLVGYGVTKMAKAVSRMVFGPGGRLPSILVPLRFEARCKPIECRADKLRELLGWTPPLGFVQCLEQTYGSESARALRAAQGTAEKVHV